MASPSWPRLHFHVQHYMNSPHTPLCYLVSLYSTSLWCPGLHYTIIIIQHYIVMPHTALSCPSHSYGQPLIQNWWRDRQPTVCHAGTLQLSYLSIWNTMPPHTFLLLGVILFFEIFKSEELCVHLFLAGLYRWPQFSTENFSKRTFQFFQSSLFQLCLCFCFAMQTSFLHFSLHFFRADILWSVAPAI